MAGKLIGRGRVVLRLSAGRRDVSVEIADLSFMSEQIVQKFGRV
ncbi:hypothetical protein AXX16_2983 [Serratia rubidaea]|nr:hypothetical protein AXX16_2983 [Serratia rubidaea]